MKKTVVITGAASGVGLSTAARLIKEGWLVWGLDLSQDKLREAAASIGASTDDFRVVACDVGSAASTAQAFALIEQSSPSIQALVCSAGIARVGALEDMPLDEMELMIDVNIKGPLLCMREAVRLLRVGATQAQPNRIVVLGSVSGLRPKVGSGFYAATKAASHVLSSVMGYELAATGITVNSIAPGTVNTPMIAGMVKAAAATGSAYKTSGKSPLGRIAEPEDVAGVVSFLLSDDARYLNGIVLPVDGGTRAAHAG